MAVLPGTEKDAIQKKAMGVRDHREAAPDSVRCYIVTVSDTRNEETDESGRWAAAFLEKNGHKIAGYRIVLDEPNGVQALIREIAANDLADMVLLNGGTGLSSRDSTYEAINGLLDKRLDGFGELFRYLSFKEIGPAAMLTRALAGSVGSLAVFSTPGSPEAVKLALEKLIGPELCHVVRELSR